VIRLGSTTEIDDSLSSGGSRIEINKVAAIQNSMSKLRMKNCFTQAGVTTAEWFELDTGGVLCKVDAVTSQTGKIIRTLTQVANLNETLPLVAKHVYGSRGTGNYLLKTREEFDAFVAKHRGGNYIYERFHDYNREYRLHVTSDGCFYTCRKLLKEETPERDRWFRNDSNSTWILENNPSFDRPTNWDAIVAECVKALNAVGLDFGACDVKVQSAKNSKDKDRKEPKFFIIEINSAPSFGTLTTQKYLEEIPKLLTRKYNAVKQAQV
jgi:carbamoylphosphate synthase large subunit